MQSCRGCGTKRASVFFTRNSIDVKQQEDFSVSVDLSRGTQFCTFINVRSPEKAPIMTTVIVKKYTV